MTTKFLYSSGFGFYGDLEYDRFGFKLCYDDFWDEVGILSDLGDLEQKQYQEEKVNMKLSHEKHKKLEISKRTDRLTRAWLFKHIWKYGKYQSAYKRLSTDILQIIVKNKCFRKITIYKSV